MTSPVTTDVDMFERVLQSIVSVGFIDQVCRRRKVKVRAGIYSLAVVVWLRIYQRLNSKRTLSSAVQFLAREALHWRRRPLGSRAIREGRISTRTGGYCRARLKMSKLVATDVCDHLLEQLQVLMREQVPDVGRPVFVIDGTTLRLPHRPELVKAFPPGSNQHGHHHWPMMLLVAFHDVNTGLALRPSWGPMYGKRAVGEQQLAAEALQRLPADAVVLADADFGIFAFAHAVQQTQRVMIFRLTTARAQKVLGGTSLRPGRRRKVRWEASDWDRKSHPDLAEGAGIEGWVVACPNPSRRGEMLFFFTTLDVKPKRILALYGLRWNIETDLRSLKRTVNLHQVTSKSQTMVEKEVLMAIGAYNVVRAVQYLSASQAAWRPRQLSFSIHGPSHGKSGAGEDIFRSVSLLGKAQLWQGGAQMITSTSLMSKTLAAAVYDDSQETLQLDFRDGSRYVYSRVHPDLFRAMLAATSKGRFFNQHIRCVLPYS